MRSTFTTNMFMPNQTVIKNSNFLKNRIVLNAISTFFEDTSKLKKTVSETFNLAN